MAAADDGAAGGPRGAAQDVGLGADLRARYAQALAQLGRTRDPAQDEALGRLEALRERLISASGGGASWLSRWLPRSPSPERTRGLYLWGPVGRGKTWLMDMFHASLPPGLAVRQHFHHFMHDVHARLKDLKDQVEPLERVADALARESRVLCFDELFVTDIADAMILGGLFAGLFRRGVTLVATSNSAPQDLYRDGLQRQRFIPTIGLIEQHVEVVHVDGGVDHRRRRLAQAGTYMMSTDPGTRQRMESLFGELSGQMGASTEPLVVDDRPIPVIRQASGVAWFGFEALCAGPRSQEDYIQIARLNAAVLLSDVPVLDALHDNEARRLIALVDELYDRRVKLIVSAAAPPAQLYRGTLLATPFERAVSRLIEMQSEEYLAGEHRP